MNIYVYIHLKKKAILQHISTLEGCTTEWYNIILCMHKYMHMHARVYMHIYIYICICSYVYTCIFLYVVPLTRILRIYYHYQWQYKLNKRWGYKQIYIHMHIYVLKCINVYSDMY